jgi:AraC family transcriptional regulator
MGPQLAVSAGASRVQRLAVTVGQVASLRFAPDLTLPSHRHPEATIAVILTGGFSGSYRGAERELLPRSVVVEPAGEQHANRFGGAETSILSLSIIGGRLGPAVEAALEAATARFRLARDPFAERIARRAANELDRPDDVTPLAVEAAALELIARVTRTARPERRPAWLADARSLLHDRFTEPLSLAEISTAVGVEPDRLARGFRRAFGEPVAGYVRRLRVDAAAVLLTTTDLAISRIAADVGFADQSHLTRWFGRYVGVTPGRYREARRRTR